MANCESSESSKRDTAALNFSLMLKGRIKRYRCPLLQQLESHKSLTTTLTLIQKFFLKIGGPTTQNQRTGSHDAQAPCRIR